MNRAVFLDRDGTLIEEKEYLSRPEDMVLLPSAVPALKSLQKADFKLFVVTNQSGVGRGYFTMEDVDKVHDHLCRHLAQHGISFACIYVAPEHPHQPSPGRKPSPQFLFEARDQFGIDLSRSYMVGDKLIDLECGWNAGVNKSILVRTGYGRQVEQQDIPRLSEAVIVNDVGEAAQWILAQREVTSTSGAEQAKARS